MCSLWTSVLQTALPVRLDGLRGPRCHAKGVALRASLCTMGLGRSGLARGLVSAGFTLVGVGNVVWVGLDSPYPLSENFFWIVTAVGFVLLGVAFRAWLKTLSKAENADPRMRIVFR